MLAVCCSDFRNHIAGVAVLRVLWPEGSLLFVLYHETHEFHEVPDVEHAAFVLHLGEHGEFLGELGEQRIVALAVLPKDHGRTQNHDLEGVAIKRTESIFGLDLAVAIAVGGVHGRFARNEFAFANGGAVAIHDGAAHENELLDTGLLGLGGARDGQVGVHGVVEFCTFFANFAAIAVGNARHVVNSIVLAKIKIFPGVANHIERIDLVFPLELGFGQVVGKARANVTVRACDEDFLHLLDLPLLMEFTCAALHHAVALEHAREGSKETLAVKGKALAFYVFAVKGRLHGDFKFIAAVNLRPAGKANGHVVRAVLVAFRNQVVLIPQSRTRAYNAHGSAKDVEHLREFVEASLAQESAHPGNPFFGVGKFVRGRVFRGVGAHSAELVNVKVSLVETDALLLKKHGAAAIELDG